MGKTDDDLEMSSDTRQLARFPDEPDIGRHHDDKLREQVTLKIEYIKCDYDRDDIVELRRVVRVGDVILENEVAEESEFTLWSPIRVSHRAIGRSIADTLLDIQKIRTVITRRAMDSLSQALTRGRSSIRGRRRQTRASSTSCSTMTSGLPSASTATRTKP